jgi:hypothetical protein
VLELDCGLEFDVARAEQDFFPALRPKSAVCLIEPREQNAEPFLIRTQNLQRRLQRLLGPVDAASKRLNLSGFASGIRYRLTGSAFEQTLTYYQHAKQLFPKRYRDLVRFRPPAVLKVNLRNAYPRCYVTRKIPVDSNGVPAAGSYYGPFPSRRSAEAFSGHVLDLFKVRRCQIKIRRDPSFPGCIYSEMKMCLAPCFAGCSKQEYDAEVRRVTENLESAGAALTRELESQREAASDSQDFERAAAVHKKLEKVSTVAGSLPELARRVDELDAVILQRAAEEDATAVFAVHSGLVADPFLLRFGEISSQPRPVEEILRAELEAQDGGVKEGEKARRTSATALASRELRGSADALEENLSLLARWFYSNPRQGEIFFRRPDWPYRRMIRACSRLLAPPAV